MRSPRRGGMRVLALVPEAHGGFGGIAVYNRELLDACCELPFVSRVKVLPRVLRQRPEGLPPKVEISLRAARGLAAFSAAVAASAVGSFDAVLCSHLYLLPFARAAALGRRTPILCMLYGVEAWAPTRRPLVDRFARRCDLLIAISQVTADRFRKWSGVPESRVRILPNAIDMNAYGMGPKPGHLVERYGLSGKRVILTLGRLDSRERQKGIDELIELMPRLAENAPDLVYLVAGEGDDRDRLERKVATLGLAGLVIFVGRIAEEEKADHFRLCDVYSMAGRQEGLGFVFLEALATGAPVVASTLDGSRNAVLDGALGELANPDDPDSLHAAIMRALARPRAISPLLHQFSRDNFRERLGTILGEYAFDAVA